ncbi:MAG: superoxide dismutase family protein [Chryseosolibacter sp.]
MKKLLTGNVISRRTGPSGQNAMSFLSLLFVALFLSLSACSSGSKQGDEDQAGTEAQQEQEESKVTAKATMEPASGSKVTGEATFTQEGGSVVFEITIENLTPGEHAVHLHEKGDCSAEDGSSAGGHWNPTMKPHGKRGNGTAFHKGDIANITAGQDGKGTLRLSINDWTIGGADSTNVVGKSVIVHAKPDDFTSQPAGNAGDRISCGVIKAD